VTHVRLDNIAEGSHDLNTILGCFHFYAVGSFLTPDIRPIFVLSAQVIVIYVTSFASIPICSSTELRFLAWLSSGRDPRS
jgi:hypothetical protein